MPVRNVDINRKGYEHAWGEVSALLEARLADPDATIGDALAVIDIALSEAKVGTDAFRVHGEGLDAPIGGNGERLGQLVSSYGRYQAVPPGLSNQIMARLVVSRLPEDVETIVEFGSGVGQNIVYAALACGRKDLRFVGCELTDTGRAVTERMAGLMPGYRIETRSFDYTDWDFSFLREDEKVFAFTHFSIEQVTQIDAGFFTGLIEACGSVIGMHMEGCNWQRFPKLRAWYDRNQQTGVLPKHTIVATQDQFGRNAAFWAVLHGYNRNLLEVLDKLEKDGRIEMLETVHDFYGTNPIYPGSLLHWRGLGGG